MKQMKNCEVVENWLTGEPATNHRGSLTTDGKRIWSYRLLVGDTCIETGMKVLRKYTANSQWGFKSQTTSCHVGLIARRAGLVY